MSPETLSKVFVPYSNSENEDKDVIYGAGFGLALSNTIINQMGGQINVTSAEGTGSTFWFEIALKVSEAFEKIPFEYDFVAPFSDGRAAVCRGSKCGYIDVDNNEVIAIEYDYVGNFEDGLAIVGRGEDFYYIDVDGNFVKDYDDDILHARVPDFMD